MALFQQNQKLKTLYQSGKKILTAYQNGQRIYNAVSVPPITNIMFDPDPFDIYENYTEDFHRQLTVTVTGGSGQFTYEWVPDNYSVFNGDYYTLSDNIYMYSGDAGASCDFEFMGAGNWNGNITCIVTDIVSGQKYDRSSNSVMNIQALQLSYDKTNIQETHYRNNDGVTTNDTVYVVLNGVSNPDEWYVWLDIESGDVDIHPEWDTSWNGTELETPFTYNVGTGNTMNSGLYSATFRAKASRQGPYTNPEIIADEVITVTFIIT